MKIPQKVKKILHKTLRFDIINNGTEDVASVYKDKDGLICIDIEDPADKNSVTWRINETLAEALSTALGQHHHLIKSKDGFIT